MTAFRGLGRFQRRRDRAKLEQTIAAIWASVLEREHVDVTDDFFELGGNSLLAIWIVGRVEETFEVELSMSSLLESRTIAGMADHVELAASASRRREL